MWGGDLDKVDSIFEKGRGADAVPLQLLRRVNHLNGLKALGCKCAGQTAGGPKCVVPVLHSKYWVSASVPG